MKPERDKDEALELPVKAIPDAETVPTGPDLSWVEASIWTERMLSALGNGVKTGTWCSLIDKVYAPKTLERAWAKVRVNQGAAGVDGQSIGRFAAKADLYLSELAADLRAGTYQPQAVKRVDIPKGPIFFALRARGQDATVGHSDGQGSHRPAGCPARDRTDLRDWVLRGKLSLPRPSRLADASRGLPSRTRVP